MKAVTLEKKWYGNDRTPRAATIMAIPATQRRSQRLFVNVPVVVEGQRANKSKFSEATRTIVVNAHGALVELSMALEPGQSIILQNVRSAEIQQSTVKLVSPGDSGKFNVAVEFTNPAPNFWHISFPPDDWSSKHMDAKKNR